MTTTTERQLPYDGLTVADFRLQTARDAYRGEQATEAIVATWRDDNDPMPPDQSDRMHLAVTASGLGWGVVALIAWLADKYGDDVAYSAAAMIQDIQMNGGNRWCEDIPYPPTGEAVTA